MSGLRPALSRCWSLAVAVALAGSACESGARPERATRPPTPPVVTVTMREYGFEVSDPIPAGRVVFRMINAGSEPHRPSLLALDDTIPPIDVQVRGSERRFLSPFAGVNVRTPGATGTFAVDLAEGRRYAFVCFAQAPDGQGHAQKGMTWESRAGSFAPLTGTSRP